ncbi:mannosyltransferase [Trypanosoma brucei brucei TREU927]|uniref:GPI mannosyltransferase 1 n=2 Tax=Trypanosoma brucei brucei (strain 927/4 GUTat10.1) TaxID=185431 RepID=PIGM_TRYB2|nr:mannosyltransferase [Trypanosoma brucei brucei TREU927]Q9BPQ5.2 RecName: Full=GPI mannosyltransferase 1; AltName: Full=GPI mannosyltransferase I; Short=GPI-MT-I; AltName: Full=Phosphatidylinositol-glycan biosynthesis class M protein; Short=PIG-M; AltName: Full=TbPIG-M [Trypanosoma brucei brucei TREU927]AAX79949.1 mannosyltransferase [Trypanosoma brucei]AAZ11892.1 mannosyltransferase [Trypanosoma brucei brucei TREU927]
MELQSLIDTVSLQKLLLLGALLRLILIAYAFFHDQWFRVKYTDIDYMIVVDGARHMWNGGSPFDRTTFRYTPLLAALVMPSIWIANPMGKLIFASSDLGAAWYCYGVLKSFAKERSAKWMVSLFILFNPIVLSVSTRGNSDMLVTFMSLMVLSKFARRKCYQAAAVLGFAVHFKIYPIIYALPLTLGVWEQSVAASTNTWRRVVKTAVVVSICALMAAISFAVPTVLCYMKYGQQYLNEAFIYHVYREDHRHNFSPYWLLMYLNMARRHLGQGVDFSPRLVAFAPQAVVLSFVSYKLRRNTAHACCVQTVLFVAFNKVCTVQYFVWFIPFLAFLFCEPKEVEDDESGGSGAFKFFSWVKALGVVLMWAATIPLWVTTAVPLEFHGYSDFAQLWIVSCLFFLAMVVLASMLARIAYRVQCTKCSAKSIKVA